MPKNRKPDLHFGPSVALEGFTSAGVQGFSDLNPAAVVRELIQNSLDAVREDGRTQAVVWFDLATVPLKEIPAIDTYRATVRKAVRTQRKLSGENGELADQAEMVVDAIGHCLNKTKVPVLSVLDNGIGLNESRMRALLSDGISAKTSAASGAVGNGHLTAIPASDLRYVLYGGVSAGGEKIASGHAILASFKRDKGSMGKDGYYTLSVSNPLFEPLPFPSADEMAPMVRRKLDWIEKTFASKTGAAVIIPGFNMFRESGDLWNTIERAAACSFFAAIAEGHLKIIYQDDDGARELNKDNISELFGGELGSEKRMRKTKNFLSGSRAANAYLTVTKGTKHSVDVGCGNIDVVIHDAIEGKSRIDLCRNGMWISENLPNLALYKFSDRKPFHCLLKVTAEDGEIHRLIRKSEGPLHNHIEVSKWLQPEEQKRLKDAFKIVSDFLLENLVELKEQEFGIDDFLSIDAGKFEKIDAGKSRKWQPMPRLPRIPVAAGTGKRKGGKNGAKSDSSSSDSFRRGGNNISFGAVPVPTGLRSYKFEIHLREALNANVEAEIRFLLDENIDETCDLTYDEQFVRLSSVELDGREVADENLIKSEENILGVRLFRIDANENCLLSFDYDLPDGLAVRENEKVSLRAEIVGRRKQA